VTVQRLEKRLKTAVDSASKDSPVDLDLADPGGALHLTRGGAAYEQDLDSLHNQLFGHRF
jgi:hypothetical protein